MKDIAFVIGTMCGGGAQRVVSVLSSYLVELGMTVDVITTSDSILDYQLNDKIRFINCLGTSKTPVLKQISIFRQLKKRLTESHYKYVVAFLPMTCVYVAACKQMGGQFKYFASERMDPKQDPQSAILRLLRNWAYHKTDGMVFQTPDAQAYFKASIQKKSVIIYNPINPDLPPPNFGARKKIVISAIRLDKQKNIEMMIDAFSIFSEKYPEYQLHLYGDGTQKDSLQEIVSRKNLGARFVFKGFSREIYDRMNEAEFFVLTSNYEGVSNSMLEALCLGLPVVSTDHPIGGARMFIKHGKNGYLTALNDSESFARCMCMVAEDVDRRKKLSENAAALRSQISSEKVCRDWTYFIFGEKGRQD